MPTLPARGEASEGEAPEASRFRASQWFLWLISCALFAAVVAAAFHYSEGQEIVSVMAGTRPASLFLAVFLQAGTCLAHRDVALP